jgi:hypothetical protein
VKVSAAIRSIPRSLARAATSRSVSFAAGSPATPTVPASRDRVRPRGLKRIRDEVENALTQLGRGDVRGRPGHLGRAAGETAGTLWHDLRVTDDNLDIGHVDVQRRCDQLSPHGQMPLASGGRPGADHDRAVRGELHAGVLGQAGDRAARAVEEGSAADAELHGIPGVAPPPLLGAQRRQADVFECPVHTRGVVA